jgi:hypothetical protein
VPTQPFQCDKKGGKETIEIIRLKVSIGNDFSVFLHIFTTTGGQNVRFHIRAICARESSHGDDAGTNGANFCTRANGSNICQSCQSPISKRTCPGYEIRIIDGNCLAGTDHRLDAIRLFAAKALPGKMLVVLDPISKLVVDIFPLEDGHAQERSRFDEVLAVVKPNQIWIGDRNFCTAEFLTTIANRAAYFVIRQHGSLGWKEVSELKAKGQTETGDIFEQFVEIYYQGKPLKCRRVVIKLFKPTRDQEEEIAILTNLSSQVADTSCIAQLYRDRWSVETLFQTVTENLNGEIQTLAYPKAALFSLAMAFATYNILATIRAALGSVHGTGKVEAGLSDYYLVDEIQGLYRGMMISIPAARWQVFETFSIEEMGSVLQHLAHHVNLKRFLKAIRGEKKKRPPLIVNHKHRHVSTARCLENTKP